MLFRTATSVALLAYAASAAAKPQPYRLAVMPLSGLSLARRDTNGYIPEETVCGDGNTCSEACGNGYTQCSSNDAATHCFNPEAGQSCCSDGTGNSCETGYYCTHDNALQTWCCPDSMDLAECAAAYSVTGGLETPDPTTSEAPSSTTTSSSTSTTSTTSETPTTTSESTSESTTETPSSTTTPWTTTPVYTPTSTFVSANSTISTPAETTVISTTTDVTIPIEETTTTGSEEPSATGGAAVSGVSLSLLIAAAGFIALI